MTGKRQPLPRRDRVALYQAAPWIIAAFVTAVESFQSTQELWSVEFAPTLPWTPAVLAFAALLAFFGVRKYVRVQASPQIALRRELLRVLRALPAAESWLNRDEHAVFAVQVNGPRIYRAVTVARIPEEDVQALVSEGKAHLVARAWQVFPDQPGIECRTLGTTVTEADMQDDTGTVRFPSVGMRQYRKGRRTARKTGTLYAPIGEVRELIALLKNAEPMSGREEAP